MKLLFNWFCDFCTLSISVLFYCSLSKVIGCHYLRIKCSLHIPNMYLFVSLSYVDLVYDLFYLESLLWRLFSICSLIRLSLSLVHPSEFFTSHSSVSLEIFNFNLQRTQYRHISIALILGLMVITSLLLAISDIAYDYDFKRLKYIPDHPF